MASLALMLDDFVCIPLSSELYQSLIKRFPDRVASLIENVAWDYLERTEEDFAQSSTRGIYWANLFLPNGTQLRCKRSHSDEYGHSEVLNEKILFDGKPIRSPSQFVKKVKNDTSVNAWINVEIKRPQDRGWKIADSFR